MTTVRQAWSWAASELAEAGCETPQLDAEVLLRNLQGVERTAFLLGLDETWPERLLSPLRSWVRRRAGGEPVAYITGNKEFRGLPFYVSPAVLIPRPETEHLVEAAVELVPALAVEAGTGSGCVAASLGLALPRATVLTTEYSRAAWFIARVNIRRHCWGRVQLRRGDLLEPARALGWAGRVDLVLSNPPYVAASELDQRESRGDLWEPRLALDGGPEGLDAICRLSREAHSLVRPGGHLLLEIGYGQEQAVRETLQSDGWSDITCMPDLAGITRVVRARREPAWEPQSS